MGSPSTGLRNAGGKLSHTVVSAVRGHDSSKYMGTVIVVGTYVMKV